MCDDGTVITFEELDVGLQLEFILGICYHDKLVGKAQCIADLKTMQENGNEFGFDADVDGLEELVREMCFVSYHYILEMGLIETPGELLQVICLSLIPVPNLST